MTALMRSYYRNPFAPSSVTLLNFRASCFDKRFVLEMPCELEETSVKLYVRCRSAENIRRKLPTNAIEFQGARRKEMPVCVAEIIGDVGI